MAKAQPATKQDINDVKQDIENVLYAINTVMSICTSEFRKIDTQFKKNRSDHQKILGYIDSISKDVEVVETEQLVSGRQVDRLNRWTHEIAEKIDHKLIV